MFNLQRTALRGIALVSFSLAPCLPFAVQTVPATINYQDNGAMPLNAVFNVMVIKP